MDNEEMKLGGGITEYYDRISLILFLQDNRVFTNQVLAFLNYIQVYKTI
jgi:hypothetical protein